MQNGFNGVIFKLSYEHFLYFEVYLYITVISLKSKNLGTLQHYSHLINKMK